MKLSLTWISSILLLASIGCTREENPATMRRIANILPEVTLGSDIKGYPFPDIRLTPSIVDAESNIFILTWTILSGPEDLKIPQSYDQHVLLKNLKNGSYEIELSVKDVGGVVKDTMNLEVNLQPIDNGEFILNNLQWTSGGFGWGEVLVIPSFRLNVTSDKKFKVYIQRDNDPTWTEVIEYFTEPSHYEYYIEELRDEIHKYKYGDLLIFDTKSNDLQDTPDVKVVFQP